MNKPMKITPAKPADKPVIAQLVQLYLYDMASEMPFPIGADGRYEYDFLDRFWQHPYLIWQGDELAGFALVITGCPLTGRKDCLFMAEYFILRPYRGQGAGREVFGQILTQHPGQWQISVLKQNQPAMAFWHKVLAPFQPHILPHRHDDEDWQLFQFGT